MRRTILPRVTPTAFAVSAVITGAVGVIVAVAVLVDLASLTIASPANAATISESIESKFVESTPAGREVGSSAYVVAQVSTAQDESGARTTPKAVDRRNEPLFIEADEVDVDRDALLATFTGNVNARQGDQRLSANRVEVVYVEDDAKGLSPTLIRAFGDVAYEGNGLKAHDAERGIFDVRAQTMALMGSVVLTQADNRLEGEVVEVDMQTGRATVHGGDKRKRVTGRFDPTSNR